MLKNTVKGAVDRIQTVVRENPRATFVTVAAATSMATCYLVGRAAGEARAIETMIRASASMR